MTVEELAPYGIGTPDAEGWYPDYRIPAHLKPAAPAAQAETSAGRSVWWSHIVAEWDSVAWDLSAIHGVDLHDPAVRARSWLGVRGMILGLLRDPSSRLFAALMKED